MNTAPGMCSRAMASANTGSSNAASSPASIAAAPAGLEPAGGEPCGGGGTRPPGPWVQPARAARIGRRMVHFTFMTLLVRQGPPSPKKGFERGGMLARRPESLRQSGVVLEEVEGETAERRPHGQSGGAERHDGDRGGGFEERQRVQRFDAEQ